jgi:starch phosphorylase
MATKTLLERPLSTGLRDISQLLQQYGCGPVQLAGTDNGLYERHLLFDNAIAMGEETPRDRFEAVARSVRDILAQRWVLTEQTYERQNPKRLYYLSMEFLIGRSLANNVTNLLLDDVVKEAVRQKALSWIDLLEQEPDAALGNGGLGRLAACFMESAATLHLPAMGTDFGTSTASSNRVSGTAGNTNNRIIGCVSRIPGR